ncbi:MAG: signal peptide peptidase SppA, partial [Polyangiaceae bacterium]|nr:signal peptide peptidase SppA [Polyangiaceae bacterium]
MKLLQGLWRLAASREVGGVLLHLKAEPAGSTAHAEELGDALRMLRSRGKKVVCHLEDAGVRALHVCSQADRIYTLPAGGVRFAGLKSQYVYFGGLLGKLGVRAEFVRVAEHKTAPEQFLVGPSPTASADHQETLRELEKTILHDLGGGRRISLPELKDRVARGPFTAQEARAAGLIDGVAHDDELDGLVAEVEGRRIPLIPVEASPALAAHPSEVMGSRDRVAIVYLDGDMMDGRSRTLPLVGNRIAGSYTVAAALKQAREDSRVKAVVLRLETPGGSSLAADVLWREVVLTTRVKPVIASMGGTAASAGYYVASAANSIFANRSTITGSIGIYYGKIDLEGLGQKLGVNWVTYRTAPRADAESIFRPFTQEERQELGRKVKQFYDLFIDRVARGRHLSAAEVDAVARGKVWTGEQARERRLVDRLGGLREALEEARAAAGLPKDCPLVELPEQPRDWLSLALQLAGLPEASTEPTPPIPPDLLRLLRQLA